MSYIDRSDVKMRLMTGGDLAAVLSFDWAEIPDKEMVTSQRGDRLDTSFIAEVEGHLVGFILARIIFVGRPMVGVCQLHLIAVRPDFQQRGIGSMLLDSLHDYCKTQNIHTIRALVNEDDPKLIDYFEGLGFHPSEKINLDIACD
jgi:ribosomal protein S18 acetylase RimI-like enzyme